MLFFGLDVYGEYQINELWIDVSLLDDANARLKPSYSELP